MKKYAWPIVIWLLFETIAISLFVTKNNSFYLFNFTYIGTSLAAGMVLYARKWKYARRMVQLLVGTYMLVFLGFLGHENMQIEGILVLFIFRRI